MKLKDLTSYLSKKIAKSLNFTLDVTGAGFDGEGTRQYAVEPIAVDEDNVLHAVVQVKAITSAAGSRWVAPVQLWEVAVPLTEGDDLSDVLIMAAVGATFDERALRLETTDYRRKAFEALRGRLDDWSAAPPRFSV